MRLCFLVGMALLLGALLPVSAARGASIGVEGVKYFSNHNAALGEDLDTLSYTFNLCNGVWNKLNTGDSRNFYFGRTDCWEQDLRDVGQGGLDSSYGDNVDLFFLCTHGNNSGSSVILAYDTAQQWWHSDTTKWKLGDRNLEWLALYACRTLPFSAIWDTCSRFFYGLHMVLGSHDSLWDCWTTEECGRDFAQNLKDGDRVSDAWLDGLSDWWCDQNALVASAERFGTYRGGDFDWPNTTMDRDHYHGRGYVCSDIPHSQIYWFGYSWID